MPEFAEHLSEKQKELALAIIEKLNQQGIDFTKSDIKIVDMSYENNESTLRGFPDMFSINIRIIGDVR